jgi:RecJ-like exonuclease
MGSCIICGAAVDGRVCDTHEEDAVFRFRGSHPEQLVTDRYYEGSVDGYADFGVFVDIGDDVTGLLHESELDQRLESLDWEAGDTVYVQVLRVRDNGNVDLGWSIRQREADFRGALVHDPGADEPERLPDEGDGDEAVPNGGATADDAADIDPGPVERESTPDGDDRAEAGADGSGSADDRDGAGSSQGRDGAGSSQGRDGSGSADDRDGVGSSQGRDGGATADAPESTADLEEVPDRSPVGELGDRVGDRVALEGEVVGVRQTGGPTVFEVRDESGAADVAAFVGAGVRAYPDIETDDVVRVVGEVELRHEELQVESEVVERLEGDDAATVTDRLAAALEEKARPDELSPLADHAPVAAVTDELLDAATAIRRAVLDTRPIVVRHTASADGYVAGAAIERAVLPLVREEHARGDAEYHFFDRRPLEDPVYGMADATNDVTDMLEGRDRHDEKLPLVVLVDAGSTADSAEGIELLDVYGTETVVIDADPVDETVADLVPTVVSPPLSGVDDPSLSTAALSANLAAAVDGDVRGDLLHLPAVSYWEDTPGAYFELAEEAGYDADATRELREAVALKAFYQTYEDKRELVADLLFGGAPTDGDARGLAAHVSQQFREKLDEAVETARANVETREVDGARFSVLDAESFAHRYDFPPTALLADALHRRERDGDGQVTVVVGTDELYVRSDPALDIRTLVDPVDEHVPAAGVRAVGGRHGRLQFLAGERDEVLQATLTAVADQLA